MFIRQLYKIGKPVVSKSKLLKDIVFNYGLRFNLFPKVLTIAVTYKCQCECAHCGVSAYRGNNLPDFSYDEIISLLDQAARIKSIMQVTFSGGEPLLRKDIFELVNHSKRKGFFTKIDTNGELLDKKCLDKLKTAGLDRVGVSLDHYTDHHDNLRKRKGLFDKVIKNIKLCRKYNVSCYLQTYVTKQSLKNGDLEKIIRLGENLGAEKIKIQPAAASGNLSGKNNVILDCKDFIALDKLLNNYKSAYIESEFLFARNYRKFCGVGFKTNIHILGNGDVIPCCWFPASFGNVKEKKLKEIMRHMYNNGEFKNLLKQEGCLCSNTEVLSRYSCI